MNKQQMIQKRWKKTDQTLNNLSKQISIDFKEIRESILELVLSLDIGNVNKKMSTKDKKIVESKLSKWKHSDNLYLRFLISKMNGTYRSALEVLLCGFYDEANKKITSQTKQAYNIIAKDTHAQAVRDLPNRKPFVFDEKWIDMVALVSVFDISYRDYLSSVMTTNANEMLLNVLGAYKKRLDMLEQTLKDVTNKQEKRLINVKGDKQSGVLVGTAITVGNSAYLKAFDDYDDVVVRFIAERDDRTTKMCKSLDDQIFYVHKMNVYQRYSDAVKGMATYKTFGLKQGENLPPITDHFHWCRSTVTYNIDNTNAEQIRSHHNGNTNYWKHTL